MSEASADRGLTERLRAERDERRRLAELIHDGPVQHRRGDRADARCGARTRWRTGDDEIGRRIVTRALEVAHEASVDLREIVSGIEPDALSELGFAGAVRELAERLSVRRGVEIELDVDGAGDTRRRGAVRPLPGRARGARPGGAPRASLADQRLPAGDAGGRRAPVADDGGQERRQAVLDGLAERAAELNGTFASETTDAGTWIAVRLPPSAAHL